MLPGVDEWTARRSLLVLLAESCPRMEAAAAGIPRQQPTLCYQSNFIDLSQIKQNGTLWIIEEKKHQKKSVLFSSSFVPSSNPCFSSIYLNDRFSVFFSSQCARISVEIALQWMGCTWKIVVKSHKTFKQASLQQRDKLPFEVWRESPSACDFKLFVPFSSTREYKTSGRLQEFRTWSYSIYTFFLVFFLPRLFVSFFFVYRFGTINGNKSKFFLQIL